MTAAQHWFRWIGAMLAVALLALLASAAVSFAQTVVPPGNSEADQYFEATPDATGDKSIDGSRSAEDVLTPKQLAELEALGPDGAAAAALAAGTAPSAETLGAGEGEDPAAEGSAAPAGSAALITDRQGMGAWLWVIVAASAFIALGFGVARWRARGGAGPSR